MAGGSDDDLVLRMSPLVRSSASTLSRNQPGQHQTTNLFLHRIKFLFLNFCADLKPIEFGIGGGCGGKKDRNLLNGPRRVKWPSTTNDSVSKTFK
jgi:hypothetical protein